MGVDQTQAYRAGHAGRGRGVESLPIPRWKPSANLGIHNREKMTGGMPLQSLQTNAGKPLVNLGIHNRVLKPFFAGSLRHATRTAAIAFKRHDREMPPGRATRMHEAAHD